MPRVCGVCGKELIERQKTYCSNSCTAEGKRNPAHYCKFCGAKMSRSHKTSTCKACTHLEWDGSLIEELETKLGISLGEYLRRRYCDEDASMLEIEVELGLGDNNRRMKRLFSRYGIEARSASEAVALQHKRDPDRGVAFGEHTGSREARLRVAAAHQRQRKLTSVERAALSAMRGYGLDPVPQYAVDVYNIDLAFPEIKLGIEIDGGNWHQEKSRKEEDAKRDDFLTSRGWTIKRYGPDQFFDLLMLIEELAFQLEVANA